VLVIAPIAIGSVASVYQQGLPNANLPWVSHRLSSYLTVLVDFSEIGDVTSPILEALKSHF